MPRPIAWVAATDRYGEKLATPDITIADLIGEVDPVKVAEGRYLSDELTIHYGLLPRTNRGIFALNELPDLAERIQVGLLNLMEERDVQIRGYKVRLSLDLFVVASRQPGGLHEPRPDHHAAEGPIRGADPDPLPGGPRDRDRDHGGRVPGLRRRDRRASIPVQVPSLHEGDRRRAVAAGPPVVRGQPALRGERAGHASPTTRRWWRPR